MFADGAITDFHMGETKPIPVRLGKDLIARLDAAALAIGTTRAGVIRFCVQSWLRHFEAQGGIASLPVDWDAVMKSHDGRGKKSIEQSDLDSKKQRTADQKGRK